MPHYWTSKKDNALLEDRRAQLDNLLEFAKADLSQPESAAIQERIVDLLFHATTPGPGCKRVLHVENHRDLLPELQEHINNHLDKIVRDTKMPAEMPFLIFNGSLDLTIARGGTRFYQRLRLLDVKEGDELNILKHALNLTLLQVIRDLDLRPKRFRKCQRCKAIFYQPTARKKDYCSTRCNDAVRLQRFRKQKSAASQKGGESAI